jgi:hypothetical protein
MRISYRTLRSAYIKRLAITQALFGVFVLALLVAVAAAVLHPGLFPLILIPALLGVFVLAFMPRLRGYGLTLDASTIQLDVDGTVLSMPWELVESLRVELLPVPQERWGSGSQQWHVVVTPKEHLFATAVPLHTFRADVDEICQAILRFAPESVDVDLGVDEIEDDSVEEESADLPLRP